MISQNIRNPNINKAFLNANIIASSVFFRFICSFFFWMSFIAFREAISQYPEILNKNHSCGMGNSYKKIKNIIPDSKKLTCYLSYEDWKKDILND